MNIKNNSIPMRVFLRDFLFLFFVPLALSLSCVPFPTTPEETPGWEEVEETPAPSVEPNVQETETEIKVELSGDVLFDFNKWNIRPAAEPILQKVADVIKRYPDATVLIEGYTDSKGSDSYNLRLSQKRADSVKDWLVKKGGINAKGMTAKGLGESKPVAPNENPDGSDNPDGRQKNRRVEITVKKG